jgi:sugar phosphate isomerase/epimerase
MPRMNRRTFVKTTTAAATAAVSTAMFPWRSRAAQHEIGAVGIQLYTVRQLMKDDFPGTLAKVAGVGYKEVEFAGLYNRTPKEVRAILDQNGLRSPSGHVPYATVEKQWPETIEAAHVLGQKFIVCPWIDEKQRTADGMKRAAELFNKAGETSRKAGVQFAYHNHSWEFSPLEGLGGKTVYDYLLENTDPKDVKMEMDLCWISVTGNDPLTYFQKYPGRFPLVHVKDWVKDGTTSPEFAGAFGPAKYTGRMADVGQGSIDWKRIFADSTQAGIQHYFVENDEPKSPLEDIRVSYEYLHGLRF